MAVSKFGADAADFTPPVGVNNTTLSLMSGPVITGTTPDPAFSGDALTITGHGFVSVLRTVINVSIDNVAMSINTLTEGTITTVAPTFMSYPHTGTLSLKFSDGVVLTAPITVTAHATIGTVSSFQGHDVGDGEVDVTVAVDTGADRLLIAVSDLGGADQVFLLVDITQNASNAAFGNSGGVHYFDIPGPLVAGPHALSLQTSGGTTSLTVTGFAISLTNINAATPYGAVAGSTGSSTTPSASIPSSIGDVILSLLASEAAGTPRTITQGAGQTALGQVVNATTTSEQANVSKKSGLATTTPISHTMSATALWYETGVALKPQ